MPPIQTKWPWSDLLHERQLPLKLNWTSFFLFETSAASPDRTNIIISLSTWYFYIYCPQTEYTIPWVAAVTLVSWVSIETDSQRDTSTVQWSVQLPVEHRHSEHDRPTPGTEHTTRNEKYTTAVWTAFFPGEPGLADSLSDFFLYSIWKRAAGDKWHRFFNQLDVLPVTKPTMSMHWRNSNHWPHLGTITHWPHTFSILRWTAVVRFPSDASTSSVQCQCQIWHTSDESKKSNVSEGNSWIHEWVKMTKTIYSHITHTRRHFALFSNPASECHTIKLIDWVINTQLFYAIIQVNLH